MGVPFRWILHVGITGSYDATVRVWDLKSRSFEPIQVIDDARDSVTSLQVTDYEILTGSVLQYFFFRCDDVAWSRSVDSYVRNYDLRMGKLYQDCVGSKKGILRLFGFLKDALI